MREVGFLAFLALIAFGGFAFWRGLGTKPLERYRAETIAAASDDHHAGQPDGGPRP